MTPEEIRTRQQEIVRTLGVQPVVDVRGEAEKRIQFLMDAAKRTDAKGFVLGISGGQDSFNAGKLAQLAVDRLNQADAGSSYQFIAMRLPYGVQQDEADAQAAIDVIQPTKSITYNVKPAVDAAMEQYKVATGAPLSDYLKGNTKARFRMAAQYDVAAANGCLVIGTDHAAEALTGFYTKWGDGACDLTPLSSLNKRQGRELAKYLGSPTVIVTKKPTADLEDNRPGLPDEEALGVTYDQIDDFLEGKEIEPLAAERIIRQYDRTQHKRDPIPGI